MKHPCPACGHLVFGEPPGSFDICPECGWEDDYLQFVNPTYRGGANAISLVEAQQSLEPPFDPDLLRDPTWRPVSEEEAAWFADGPTRSGGRPVGKEPYWRVPYDKVLSVPGWWDGPRDGVAMFRGEPHWYLSRFLDYETEPDSNPPKRQEDRYDLWRLDGKTVRYALEDWAIWLRWAEANANGEASGDTHPALPADRARREALQEHLKLATPPKGPSAANAHADFFDVGPSHDGGRVRWWGVEET